MPNFYNARIKGYTKNGVYTDLISTPLPISSESIVNSVFFNTGIFYTPGIFGYDGSYTVTPININVNNYSMIINNSLYPSGVSIRLLLNDNITTVDLNFTPFNCAASDNPVTISYHTSGKTPTEFQSLSGGDYLTRDDTKQYGLKFSNIESNDIFRFIDINDVKYTVNIPVYDTIGIQVVLNSLNLGNYVCIYDSVLKEFFVFKVSIDTNYPQACSIVISDPSVLGEKELAHPFEILNIEYSSEEFEACVLTEEQVQKILDYSSSLCCTSCNSTKQLTKDV